jgi:hypothetical protein
MLTKVQRALIEDASGPRRNYGSGAGYVLADPRTVKALVTAGLAFKTQRQKLACRRDEAYLTRAGWAVSGKEPPKWAPLETDEKDQ